MGSFGPLSSCFPSTSFNNVVHPPPPHQSLAILSYERRTATGTFCPQNGGSRERVGALLLVGGDGAVQERVQLEDARLSSAALLSDGRLVVADELTSRLLFFDRLDDSPHSIGHKGQSQASFLHRRA
jgi:hypothetical protein